ncbi:primase-helicase family protein [Runella zeae]|uniref:primase-helicase family protein n=1 Tax=Runella zeae TaxID=94255 RepID=UPI0023573E25|nr:primase-helicase family protein [Runella zeae]
MEFSENKQANKQKKTLDYTQNISLDEQAKIEDAKKKEQLIQRAKSFIRVADSYYKIVHRPGKKGDLFKDYLKLNKSTITDDYTHGIIKYIPKYDDFCMVASHTNYQQVVNGFYNEYSELTHKPVEGKFDAIMSIIQHVFGDAYINFGLDYLQILYTKPYERLPILLLESTEKNTGKSTFANLIFKMFQDNAIKIGNNDLQSDFNSVWVKRLAIIVDETSLEKKGITQMLKRFSTETGKVTVNEKNKAQTEVDFFGKFIFVSNEEGKALSIERGDPRWAVFKVPTFAEKGVKDNPLIEEAIQQEIPHFLHFLIHRKLFYKKESRMYFAPEVYQTAQLQLYYNNAISKAGQLIKRLVIDTFDLFPNETKLCFGISDIQEELKGELKNLTREQVKYALETELKFKAQERGRYSYHSRRLAEINTNHLLGIKQENKVHYVFPRFDAETWKSTNDEF